MPHRQMTLLIAAGLPDFPRDVVSGGARQAAVVSSYQLMRRPAVSAWLPMPEAISPS
jgi:hypothetical protein